MNKQSSTGMMPLYHDGLQIQGMLLCVSLICLSAVCILGIEGGGSLVIATMAVNLIEKVLTLPGKLAEL